LLLPRDEAANATDKALQVVCAWPVRTYALLGCLNSR